MKFLIILLLGIGLASVIEAQTYSQAELTKSLIETEKKTIISETMDFSEVESQAFWPVYRDFEKEWEEVFNRKVELLNHFFIGIHTHLGNRLADGFQCGGKNFARFRMLPTR